MPNLPIYESQQNIDTSLYSGVAEVSHEGSKALGVVSQSLAQASSLVGQWVAAENSMQYATSKANYESGMIDIMERATNDVDYNNADTYLKEIQSLKDKSLEGFTDSRVAQKATLELGVNAQVNEMRIRDIFRKKQVDYTKNVAIPEAIAGYKKEWIAATSAADRYRVETNISELINASVQGGIISQGDGYKAIEDLKEDLPIEKANYYIQQDPYRAEEMLANGEFEIADPAKRRKLMNVARDMQDAMNYEFTRSKVETRLDMFAEIAKGEVDFTNAETIARDLAITDPEFAESIRAAFSHRSGYPVKDYNNEDFQDLTADLFTKGSSEDVSKFLISTLRSNKNISKDRLSIIADAARLRAESLPLTNGGTRKQSFFDSATKQIFLSPVSNAINVFSSFVNRVVEDEASGQQIMDIANDEIRKQSVVSNPDITSYPKEGVICEDRFGNKALVFPDGTYKDIPDEPVKEKSE